VISRRDAPTQYSPLDSEAEQAGVICACATGVSALKKSADAAATIRREIFREARIISAMLITLPRRLVKQPGV
jgi:hypothetical protein